MPDIKTKVFFHEEKECRKCKQKKSVNDFYNNSRNTDKKQAYCKPCSHSGAKETNRIRRSNGKAYVYNRKYYYRISDTEFADLMEKQNGLCAICGGVESPNSPFKRLSIDHCHITNKVRGLLCSNCNTALGKFKDSKEMLQAALSYLEETS